MTTTTETKDWRETAARWEERCRQAEERVRTRGAEVQLLQALDRSDLPSALAWLQRKSAWQRQALDRLNRKVVTQRFRLNLLRSLGRDVTYEEYIEARDQARNSRIDEYEVL